MLRLIDYCLGSAGDEIWRDPEFKTKVNQEVFDFLHGPPSVFVTLTIAHKLRGKHVLRRSFTAVGKKGVGLLSLDDVEFSSISAYRNEVKQILFGTKAKKPSLRQLAPKFIRSSNVAMSKTLKFLGSYGSEVDYEAIHLFLFGFFDVGALEDRASLTKKRSTIARDLIGATRNRKEGEIEQLLRHLRREIEQAEFLVRLRGEIPEIAEIAQKVSRIRAKASNVAETLG